MCTISTGSFRKLCTASIALMLTICLFEAWAGLDKKFYAKTAKAVWAKDMPQFNPQADLSAPVFADQQGVFIARYIGLEADYDMNYSAAKRAHFGIDRSNATRARYLRRNMVKLNSMEAVEKYTEFTVDTPEKITKTGYTLLDVKPAFGARIFKPDGSVVEIDMSEAYTMGKDGEDEKYKIAIPGLAVGDILDYFYYTESFLDEISLPEIMVQTMASYPTRNLTVDIRVAPELSVEYGAYNGLSKTKMFRDGDKNRLTFEIENIEAFYDDTPLIAEARQLPFIDIYVLNSTSRIEYVPSSARSGGMRRTNTAYLLSDIASRLKDTKVDRFLVADAAQLVKEWKKNHPGASQRELADVVWQAVRYIALTTDKKISDHEMSLMFRQTLAETGSEYTGCVGVVTSRKNVPVKDLAHFTDADYMVMAGDTCYFSTGDMFYLPGEIPAHYSGESYYVFNGEPSNPNLQQTAVEGRLPQGKAPDNTLAIVSKVAVDPSDPEKLGVATEVTMTGSMKRFAKGIIPYYELMDEIAAFFGKKYKADKKTDTQEYEEKSKDGVEDLARQIWDDDKAAVISFDITEKGCTTDRPDVKINISGSVTGAVENAGEKMIVNVGRLNGEQTAYEGHERKRTVSVIRNNPERYDNTILFEIPAGYEIMPGTIEDLTRSVVTPEGSFNTQAKIEGNTLKLQIVERYPKTVSTIAGWSDILKVNDAANEFSKAFVVLRPASN